MTQKTTVHIIAGGQYGSEGKGAFTASLVKRIMNEPALGPPVLVRVAGPNAGHTAYDISRRKWTLSQIPVGAVISPHSPIVIGQQSEIDLEVLNREIKELESEGIPVRDRLFIDGSATVILPHYSESEKGIASGTTGKGIGAARAARIMRQAVRMQDLPRSETQGLPWIGDSVRYLRGIKLSDIVIEGTQGYGLGLHTKYYPYVTSSNCRPGDFLAMTGLQPWHVEEIVPWLVFRPHPIRIAGKSGPLYGETTWEAIGQPVEYTTVTKKPRRVGTWDPNLAADAIEAAGGVEMANVALNFVDYLYPNTYGATEWNDDLKLCLEHFDRELERSMIEPGAIWPGIQYLGTGPYTGVWTDDRV